MESKLEDNLQPIRSKLRWDLSPEDVKKITEDTIKEGDKIIEGILQTDDSKLTFSNTVLELERLSAMASDNTASSGFLAYVAEDKALRDASAQANQELRQYYISLYLNKKLYDKLMVYKNSNPKLDRLQLRLLDRVIRDLRRSGLDLSEDIRDQLKKLKEENVKMSVEYSQALYNIDVKLTFSESEIDGVPDTAKSLYQKDEDGNYLVGLSYPEVGPIFQYAKNTTTRKRLYEEYAKRGMAQGNVERLEKTLQNRWKMAELMGYPNHAAFVQEVNMAKNPNNVMDFLKDLRNKLRPLGEKELDALKALKKEEKGVDTDLEIQSYEQGYYSRIYNERNYDLDPEVIKGYFPVTYVVDQMLEFYQQVLGFNFKQIENIETWHQDVISYSIVDKDSGEFLGVFFLDLFPREGKYNHAAAFTLLRERYEDQKRVPTASAMVCNFNKPTEDAPSLLTHGQVITLFHEFGHIIHQTTSQSKYVEFSGTSVARDFVEAPSQMLENWIWEPSVLKRISKHKDTGDPLPDELITKMIKARHSLTGLGNLRQIFFGLFDMKIHTEKIEDTGKTWRELKRQVTLIPELEGANGAAAFGHLMGGYDAGYYGYMWSKVFAQDMYTRFEDTSPDNPAVGHDYRKFILEPGNEFDEEELLEKFLGREPNNKAFLRNLGINSEN